MRSIRLLDMVKIYFRDDAGAVIANGHVSAIELHIADLVFARGENLVTRSVLVSVGRQFPR
jgi:hypothetical protein